MQNIALTYIKNGTVRDHSNVKAMEHAVTSAFGTALRETLTIILIQNLTDFLLLCTVEVKYVAYVCADRRKVPSKYCH